MDLSRFRVSHEYPNCQVKILAFEDGRIGSRQLNLNLARLQIHWRVDKEYGKGVDAFCGPPGRVGPPNWGSGT